MTRRKDGLPEYSEEEKDFLSVPLDDPKEKERQDMTHWEKEKPKAKDSDPALKALRDHRLLQGKEILTTKDVMQLFSIKRETLCRWCAKGLIPSLRIGGRRFFSKRRLVSLFFPQEGTKTLGGRKFNLKLQGDAFRSAVLELKELLRTFPAEWEALCQKSDELQKLIEVSLPSTDLEEKSKSLNDEFLGLAKRLREAQRLVGELSGFELEKVLEADFGEEEDEEA